MKRDWMTRIREIYAIWNHSPLFPPTSFTRLKGKGKRMVIVPQAQRSAQRNQPVKR